MRIATVRRYLRDTLEFAAYFVFMTILGAAMFVLVTYAPQANARWYINTCIAMALFTGGYAFRMYRRYRIAQQRWAMAALREAAAANAARAKDVQRWSDRIAADQFESAGPDAERLKLLNRLKAVEDAYRLRSAALGEDASERENFAIDPDLSIDAIRARIAIRMEREDELEAESRRLFR